MPKLAKQLLFYIGILLGWVLITKMKIWPEYILPSPGRVGASLLEGIADRTFIFGSVASLKRVFIGYGISIILGMALGLAIGRVRWLDETVGSMVVALQTLRSICWLPLAILWFGLNERSIIFVVIMGALLAITISTDSGVKNIPPNLFKSREKYGGQRFSDVKHHSASSGITEYNQWLKAGVVVCLALVNGGRTNLCKFRPGAITNHGARVKRYE